MVIWYVILKCFVYDLYRCMHAEIGNFSLTWVPSFALYYIWKWNNLFEISSLDLWKKVAERCYKYKCITVMFPGNYVINSYFSKKLIGPSTFSLPSTLLYHIQLCPFWKGIICLYKSNQQLYNISSWSYGIFISISLLYYWKLRLFWPSYFQ